MKSERIQMVTNETESCYTCESISYLYANKAAYQTYNVLQGSTDT